MFKKTHAFVLTCALLSFSAFNTQSYARIYGCPDGSGQTEIMGTLINSIGYEPASGLMFLSTNLNGVDTNFYNGIDKQSMSNALVQPIEITAYLTNYAVDICYTQAKDSSGNSRYWIQEIDTDSFGPLISKKKVNPLGFSQNKKINTTSK